MLEYECDEECECTKIYKYEKADHEMWSAFLYHKEIYNKNARHK